MGAWGPSIFSDDLALDIRSEYSFLLSVGKENSEIEHMLQQYYKDIIGCNDPDEDIFWFVLALCEWKKGRLSIYAKEKALSALESGRDLERWNSFGNEKNYKKRIEILKELRNILLSPMPPAVKPRKPTIHHCPWAVGSLLAYKIVANKQRLENHPCYSKYVLLRVVKIYKHPLSKLLPCDYYNESMLVGLYNWIGSEIPDPKIVDSLDFITIEEYSIPAPTNAVDFSLLNTLSEEAKNKAENAILSLFGKQVTTCAYLDWRTSKDMKGDITYLDCDYTYSHTIPDFFNTSITACPFTNYLSFDSIVAKRMEHYLHENSI